MPSDIQRYRPAPWGSALAHPVEAIEPDPPPGAQAASLAAVIRRRWPIVVGIWLLIAGVSVPYVWLKLEPSYKATAQIQLSPTQQPILYQDQDSRPAPYFEEFLNTHAELITSYKVRSAVLTDPNVRDLALMASDNPARQLQKVIEVTNPRRTYLLEVNVTQSQPDDAIRLAQAVVDAYRVSVVDEEEVSALSRREALEKRRDDLHRQLDAFREEVLRLAGENGIASDERLDAILDGFDATTRSTREQLEKAEHEIIQLEVDVQQLDQGVLPELLSADGPNQRHQLVENDPTVAALRQQLQEVTGQLLRLRSLLTDEHREVVLAEAKKKQLEEELEKARTRTASDLLDGSTETRQGRLGAAKARIQIQLNAARQRRDGFQKLLDTQDDRRKAVGLIGLKIQDLHAQEEIVKQDLDRVNEALKQLDIESKRPGRISIVSPAEIHPDGVTDKRAKFTVAAVLGALFIGAIAALLRDRFDPHLHAPQEIESTIGMRVLGAVPCLSELKTGRINHEDFVESYRVVRATLSSIGADGAPPRSILVTSAQAGEGKTSLAVSLAASLAEPGRRVLLIDGDVQAPSIGRFFKLTSHHGLQALLRGERTLDESVVPTQLPNLNVLLAGLNGSGHRGVLDTRSTARIVADALEHYDHVVVDSPPALGAADALVWARAVDGVVVASLAGHSDTVAMRLACERLRSVGANLLGAVVANVSISETYYSHSTYSYQREPDAADAAASPGMAAGLPIIHIPDPHTQDSAPE